VIPCTHLHRQQHAFLLLPHSDPIALDRHLIVHVWTDLHTVSTYDLPSGPTGWYKQGPPWQKLPAGSGVVLIPFGDDMKFQNAGVIPVKEKHLVA
jgi:hypothetical protein